MHHFFYFDPEVVFTFCFFFFFSYRPRSAIVEVSPPFFGQPIRTALFTPGCCLGPPLSFFFLSFRYTSTASTELFLSIFPWFPVRATPPPPIRPLSLCTIWRRDTGLRQFFPLLFFLACHSWGSPHPQFNLGGPDFFPYRPLIRRPPPPPLSFSPHVFFSF